MESPASEAGTGNKRCRTEEAAPQPQPQELSNPANYPRKRVSVACEICRVRKTRCDAGRPSCGFCTSLGVQCTYRKPAGVIANLMTRAKQGERFQTLQSEIDTLRQALSSSGVLPSPPLDGSPASINSSAPRSIQGYSPPIEQRLETPQPPRKSSVPTEPTKPPVTLPTVGLSHKVYALTKLSGRERPAVFRVLEYDDSEEYIEAELHAEDLIHTSGDPSQVDLTPRTCWSLQQSFVRNVLPWFPIFSQDVCVHHMKVASENHFSPAHGSTPLALYILALGAFSKADDVNGDDPREFPGIHYFMAARNMPERTGIKQAIDVLQSQILRTLFYLLCMRPLAASNSIMPASRSLVSLVHLKRHIHSDAYFRNSCYRAYWVCYVIEKELLPYSCGATSGFMELQDIIPLPVSDHDEPGMLWLLSETALRRIYVNVSGIETDPDYQPLVMKELNKQVAEWYNALPSGIKFAQGASPILDPQKAFLRSQYYSVLFVSHWSSIMRLYMSPPPNEQQLKECLKSATKCVELGILYLTSMESSALERHVLLFANMTGTSGISMLLLSIYRTPEIAQLPIPDLSETILKAYRMLTLWGANPIVADKIRRMELLMHEKGISRTG